MRSPEIRASLTLALLLGGLLPLASGCHAIGDPSCAVHEELADQRCLRTLYAPGLSLDHIDENCWHHCPRGWTPACPPVIRCPQPLRPLPTAEQVLAVPEPSRKKPESRQTPGETPTEPSMSERDVPLQDDGGRQH